MDMVNQLLVKQCFANRFNCNTNPVAFNLDFSQGCQICTVSLGFSFTSNSKDSSTNN
jgi:hypothetical protein